LQKGAGGIDVPPDGANAGVPDVVPVQ